MDKAEEIRKALLHRKSILEGAEYKGMTGPEEDEELRRLRDEFEVVLQEELNK